MYICTLNFQFVHYSTLFNMKKICTSICIALSLLFFASCKKDCTCTIKMLLNNDIVTESQTFSNISKKECNDKPSALKEDYVESVTCKQ